MGTPGARPGLTLDAGALIAIGRAAPRTTALLQEAVRVGAALIVPAAVLAQVWRGGGRQTHLARMLALPTTCVVPLDAVAARAIGTLLARSGTSDVVDASVVWCARTAGTAIVTDDPDDLRRIDPGARLVRL